VNRAPVEGDHRLFQNRAVVRIAKAGSAEYPRYVDGLFDQGESGKRDSEESRRVVGERCVGVRGDRGRRVAEHLLDRMQVCPGGVSESRRAVAKVVQPLKDPESLPGPAIL
jgi:hypothetical protein